MRSLSTDESTLLANAVGYAVHTRVKVADSGGTLRDLSTASTIVPVNMVNMVEYGETVDNNVATATVTLAREHVRHSLAPLVETSKQNLITGSYSPLLDVNRQITIETATTARLGFPQSGDWKLVFDGYIDKVSLSGESEVQLLCRDKGARVQSAFIREERVYGLGLTKGAAIWEPGTAYTAGQYVVPSKLNGHYYECTVGGTSAALTEPTWPTVGTTPFADGTVTWARVGTTSASQSVEGVMQAILTDWASASLYTAAGWTNAGVWSLANTSPGWNIKPYKQSRVPVMDALKVLADQVGAMVRYRYTPSSKNYLLHGGSVGGTNAFELQFFEPNRANTTADYTMSPSRYRRINSLDKELAEIRTRVRVYYWDSSDLDPAGQRKRKKVEVTSAGSIVTKYGDIFMEIAEGAASQIDSSTEATKMATAALTDLEEPTAQQVAEADYLWAAELNDLYEWSSNNTHYTSAQKLAVVAVQHRLTESSAVSVFTCRGKLTTGSARWHEKDSRPGVATSAKTGGQEGAGTLTGNSTIKGARISVPPPSSFYSRDLWEDTEMHQSTSSSTFTPDNTTLVARGRQSRFDITGLDKGTTYYFRAVHRSKDRQRSAVSPAVSVTPVGVAPADLEAVLRHVASGKQSGSVALEGNTSQVKPNADNFDTHGLFDPAQWGFVILDDGKYGVTGRTRIESLTPGDSGYLELRVNGSAVTKGATQQAVVDDSATMMVLALDVTAVLNLVAGDVVTLWFVGQGAATYAGKALSASFTYFDLWRTNE